MQNNQAELNEALKLLNSESGDDFAAKLENGVHTALAEARGEVKTQITSAVKLSAAEKDRLERFLAHKFRRKLSFEFQVSPDLFGGFKVMVGDWKLDVSLAGRLKAMRELFGGKNNG